MRGPVPKVRCKSRHDPEIQGRFSASSDGHLEVMGRVGREAVNIEQKKLFFVQSFCMISSNSVFSDIFVRCLEIPRGSVQVLQIYDLWGGWCCWLRVVIEWHYPSGQAYGSSSKI